MSKAQWIAVMAAAVIISVLAVLGYWHIRKANERLLTLQEQTNLDEDRSKPTKQTPAVSTPQPQPSPTLKPPRSSDFTDGDPGDYLTRSMFTAMLFALEEETAIEHTQSSFSDVPADAWYTDAVEWAAGAGIVGGIGDGKFAPDAFVSREQIAVMLYHYLQYKDRDGSADTAPGTVDSTSVSLWAREAVEGIRSLGIVPDKPNHRYDPQGKVTNEEADAVFERLLSYLQQTDYPGKEDLDENGNPLPPFVTPESSPLPVYREEELTIPEE